MFQLIKYGLLIHFLLSFFTLTAQWQSELIQIGESGKLIYYPDTNGYSLPDFSYAGYRYGMEHIPDVPVAIELSPIEGDNTIAIQSAINEISLLTPDENGIRGAVLLKAGVYQIYGSLYLNVNGVVIRGVGQEKDSEINTIILARGNEPAQRTVITIGNNENYKWNSEEDFRKNIVEDTVKLGSKYLLLENTNGLNQGDNIMVVHPCTEKWLESVDGGGTASDPSWQQDELPIRFYRYILDIRGDTVILDAPIYYPLIKDLSQSYVIKHSIEKMKQQVGIENLRIEIESLGGEDENHAWDAVCFNLVEDGWARNCTAVGFGQSGFVTQYSYRLLIDNCSAIDPVAQVTGSRMYNFNFYHGSQLVLVKDCYARNGRHNYISNGTTTVSGCVVYNSVSSGSYSAVEGHRKWSQAILFDKLKEENLRSSGRLVFALYNRGDKGTSHGWSSAFCVAWNCDFGEGRACIQKPPGSQNFAIGCHAKRISGGEADFPQDNGYIEGHNRTGLQPESLYVSQLEARNGTLQPPYESAVSINKQIVKENGFKIVPNPGNGNFLVHNDYCKIVHSITIYNHNGQVVYSKSVGSYLDHFQVYAGQQTGLYFLTISCESGTYIHKLVVL